MVSMLGPCGPSPSVLLGPIKDGLHSGLCTELVEQIIIRFQMNIDGHERPLLRNIHTESDKSTVRETADMIRQAIIRMLPSACTAAAIVKAILRSTKNREIVSSSSFCN